MVDTPKVTVIIPCHRQIDTLKRAVDSALGADKIRVYFDGYGAKWTYNILDYRGKLYTEHNPHIPIGVAGARNELIGYADDGLIIALDADDYLLPEAIDRLRSAWRPNSFVYGAWRDDDMQIYPARQPKRINTVNICQATMLFHRDDWLKVGGYDPDFNVGFDDWAFTAALISVGVEPIRIDYPIHHYSGGGKRSEKARKYSKFLTQLMADKYPSVFTARAKA